MGKTTARRASSKQGGEEETKSHNFRKIRNQDGGGKTLSHANEKRASAPDEVENVGGPKTFLCVGKVYVKQNCWTGRSRGVEQMRPITD